MHIYLSDYQVNNSLFICGHFLDVCLRFSALIKVVLLSPPTCVSLLLTGYREGFLWKRGRDNGQYLSRKFILSEREGVLKYFNKHDVSSVCFAYTLSLHTCPDFSLCNIWSCINKEPVCFGKCGYLLVYNWLIMCKNSLDNGENV